MHVDGAAGVQASNVQFRSNHTSAMMDLKVEFLKVVIDQTLPKKSSGFGHGLASQVGRDHLARELARILATQGGLDLGLSHALLHRAETSE